MKREKTKFRQLFGHGLKVKVLEWLCENGSFRFTINDIVNGAKINRKSGYAFAKLLIKKKMIVEARRVKQIQFYKLNMGHKTIRRLNGLFKVIINDNF